MMAVTRKDVLAIAALARLHVEEAEVERLTHELNGILRHVSELEALASAEMEAVAGAAAWAAPLRDEHAGPDGLATSPEDLAPAWGQGFFVVPRLPALDAGVA